MRRPRARWHHVGLFVLATTLIPAGGCSSDTLYLAYYVLQEATGVLDTVLADTNTTDTSSTDTTSTTSEP